METGDLDHHFAQYDCLFSTNKVYFMCAVHTEEN
jgi:hypothetical protein